MALTLELLQSQEGLNGLTEEQFQNIVGLSQRDEDNVIAHKYGEFRQEVENIVAAESGIQYNEGEKSSAYLTRALKQMRAASDEGAGYKTANEELNATIAKLKDDIAKGQGNEQLKADLEKYKGDSASAKKVNEKLQKDIEDLKAEFKAKLEGYRMESEIAAATTGITLKKELPEQAKKALIETAMKNVLASKHVFDETAGVFIFQDADGNPMKDKSLNNLKVADMLRMQLETMGVLETGRQQGGAGGNGNAGGSGNGSGAGVSITTAKTKVEADEIITRELMAQGHARSDEDWYKLVKEAKDANRAYYDSLPLN